MSTAVSETVREVDSVEAADTGSGTKWLRPASETETMFETLQTHGFFLTAYWFTLASVEPLREDQVRTALSHLYRKVPPLRTCFRRRGDCLWLCEMEEEAVDFQVEEEADPRRVMEDLMSQSFASHDGPLWRARLVRGAAGEDCPLEEVRASFPHTSHLILGNHHGIADGTSNVRTYNLLLKILNDVIAGRPIDNQEQLGEMVSDAEFRAMVSAKLLELEEDPENLQRLVEEKKRVKKSVPLLLQCYPSLEGTEMKTEVLFEELDEGTTRRFFQRCKKEGVSVGSAFTALVNGATIDLAKKAGRTDDTFTLNESHALNVRRFLSGDASKHLGIHSTLFAHALEAPAAWRESFWDYARTLHRSFHTNLKQDGHLLHHCVLELTKPATSTKPVSLKVPPPTDDYLSSNMQNLDALIPDAAGEHVQAARVLRGGSNFNVFLTHFVHTFRGRFSCAHCFSSHIITEGTAKALSRTIFDSLRGLV